ncbi:MAG: RNA polymerase sigma factor [Bacteroidota bacterium]
MVELDDSTLVQQTLAGNLKGFERLVERYQKAVFNLAVRMVHDPDEAADVTQGAFVKAFEHLQSYDERYKFFSWLYRIAMNEALSYLRQRKQLVNVEEAGDIPAESNDELEAEEIAQKMEMALQALSDDQRSVVVLKHIEGLSYIEIARILSISEKKVKSRLFSARVVLRGALIKSGMGSTL